MSPHRGICGTPQLQVTPLDLPPPGGISQADKSQTKPSFAYVVMLGGGGTWRIIGLYVFSNSHLISHLFKI